MLHKSKCCKNTTKTFGSLRFSRISCSFFVYFMAAFKVFTHCPLAVELSTWTSGAAAAAVTAATALAKVAIK